MHTYPISVLIMEMSVGTTPAECTFQKKNPVVTLGLKASFVKIKGYTVKVDLLASQIFGEPIGKHS